MTLKAELEALETMTLQELRRAWRVADGPRPTTRSPDLLRRLIAWHLQVAALGGLDRATKDALRRTTGAATRARPPVGSRLMREWKGMRHEVEVTADGYLYDGRLFPSLSAIANRITASKWNGWRFFGLGDAPAAVRRKAKA